MEYLSSAVFIIGLLAEVSLFALLIVMGKRLGQALELPSYHRFYWMAMLVLLLPLPFAWIFLATKAWGFPEPGTQSVFAIKVLAALIPTSLAITFAVFPTAKYWDWIWKELRKPAGGGEDCDEAKD
ncbi:MAG: hypothetical protein A2W01_09065 [Candidatus Solincola sediminis]|uniref:Uncharacterized protein n=1 Tax=Candidatus Solincola sediminis TaxID=1797199 RepID=A0A1F2WR53_9ACTN|nr:MAG: hypothetical protein A2Y75_11000 [Candidatus Solincola sediminis]OFW60268.1 MAG: hypothetical protein A2W01_09065 [Candidatus Solincola sediminis]